MPTLIQVLASAGLSSVFSLIDQSVTTYRPGTRLDQSVIGLVIDKFDIRYECLGWIISGLLQNAKRIRIYLKNNDDLQALKLIQALETYTTGCEFKTIQEINDDVYDDKEYTDIFLCLEDCKEELVNTLDKLQLELCIKEMLNAFLRAEVFIESSKRPKMWIFFTGGNTNVTQNQTSIAS